MSANDDPIIPEEPPHPGISWRAGALGLAAVAVLCTLFMASYLGALHRPEPHGIEVAVPNAVPAQVTDGLRRTPGITVIRVSNQDAAREAIDQRKAYASLTPGSSSGALVLTVAPAASPSVAQLLSTQLPERLEQGGAKVSVRTVHELGDDDPRGLVGFYAAISWIVAGYLGATVLALAFGSAPRARRTSARLIGVAALGLVMGTIGAILASAIGGIDQGLLGIALVGALTTFAVGAATVALQSTLGMVGTGVAILLFVVIGNPSAGGASAYELVPEPWQTVGPLLPNGAATTALRDLAYFPDASITGPLLVLLAWAVVASAIALVIGARRPGLSAAEAEASLAGVG